MLRSSTLMVGIGRRLRMAVPVAQKRWLKRRNDCLKLAICMVWYCMKSATLWLEWQIKMCKLMRYIELRIIFWSSEFLVGWQCTLKWHDCLRTDVSPTSIEWSSTHALNKLQETQISSRTKKRRHNSIYLLSSSTIDWG